MSDDSTTVSKVSTSSFLNFRTCDFEPLALFIKDKLSEMRLPSNGCKEE